MSAFWVTFDSGNARCVEAATSELATERAATVGVVKSVQQLPYPAEPRMEPHETYTWNNGTVAATPSFCYKPRECAGRSSCPQRYACSE